MIQNKEDYKLALALVNVMNNCQLNAENQELYTENMGNILEYETRWCFYDAELSLEIFELEQKIIEIKDSMKCNV